MTDSNLIFEVLAAPLGLEWTIEGVAEKLLSAVADQPGSEPKKFVFDASAATDQQSRRLIRPLLACLANMSAAESGTSDDIFGTDLLFKRTGPEGLVWIHGQFKNNQADVHVYLQKTFSPPSSQNGNREPADGHLQDREGARAAERTA